ncbi:hypothetical protein F511_20070 [Dorcoceras hygrometricum]|uniref:CCHC-type domain-containing protein n=1 Tax=Dorcoceras hygrometricum TaxID=472368 RepID=A0A2Z7BRI5_9LAMI|nr:hypothetical protein F511_20070 [Dorcoceras hygrometricum]
MALCDIVLVIALLPSFSAFCSDFSHEGTQVLQLVVVLTQLVAPQEVAQQSGRQRFRPRGQQFKKKSGSGSSSSSGSRTEFCDFCGGKHPSTQCVGVQGSCNLCGQYGHFARVCPSAGSQQTAAQPQGRGGRPPPRAAPHRTRNSARDTMCAGRAWWSAVASSHAQIVARWCAICAPCLAHGVAEDAALGTATCGQAPHAMLAAVAAVRSPSGESPTAMRWLFFL